jgi:hypothetical protein
MLALANAYGTMVLKAWDEGKWIKEYAAVAEARAEKQKATTKARKKNIAEQFKELQRNSDKITEEIGWTPLRFRQKERSSAS